MSDRDALAAADRAAARVALAGSDRQLVGAGTRPYVTPAVRAEAARLGVDLAAVTGTGVGGRVTTNDVRSAAGRGPYAVAAKIPARGRGPAYATNPLLDQVLQDFPQLASRRAAQPPPTLFLSGDLPPWTASGIDPSALMTVPWQARHVIASAPTTAEAFRLLELYAGDPEAADAELGTSASNGDYRLRMKAWVTNVMTDDEIYELLNGDRDRYVNEQRARGNVLDGIWEQAKQQ